MSLQGIVRRVETRWMIEHTYSVQTRPILVGTRWEVLDTRRTGPFAPDLEEGLQVTYGQSDRWAAYRQGDYLFLDTAKMGERIPEQPIPCPKVKKGVDVRYYLGRWEKYSKRDGWVIA